MRQISFKWRGRTRNYRQPYNEKTLYREGYMFWDHLKEQLIKTLPCVYMSATGTPYFRLPFNLFYTLNNKGLDTFFEQLIRRKKIMRRFLLIFCTQIQNDYSAKGKHKKQKILRWQSEMISHRKTTS